MKPRVRRTVKQRPNDPLWFKDAVFYQMRIASFADSDGDGIGDFRGAMSRLDYLHDLGVNLIWLLPFYPSPGRDDGYDTADYMNVAPQYGTLDDFRAFMDAAHARSLRVMTELVINHTSDQHAWFQRARRAPKGSPERDFYVWSDDNTRYSDVRIIFTDYEQSNWTWDPLAEQFYWHRFFHHQPDLNYDNPLVHEAVFEALDFWLNMGVDGLRLDAIPYLYEREGTNGENLPETHAFLRKLRAHVDAHHPGRVLLAEANQWAEDAVAYFGDGDECHMSFHFPIMPRLYLALRTEERYPIVDILDQTPPIPDSCQWAMFLRNHDELTLEMVTEEERELMRRAYAPEKPMRINLGIRRRLAPLLNGDRRAIELMNALLFSMPGTPIIYYGDEIGMGDNVYLGDRNGVRTPMQWSPDRNGGFSSANPQKLALPPITDPAYHYEAINVEVQSANPASLLWWMRRIIHLRQRYKAFGRGSIEFLKPENGKILAYIRRYHDETILCVVNLSRYPQSAALDLGAYAGAIPVEMFGATPFPPISDQPYLLTLGAHSFYWFEIPAAPAADPGEPASLSVQGGWESVTQTAYRPELTEALVTWLVGRAPFDAHAATFEEGAIVDLFTLERVGLVAIVRLAFSDDTDDLLCLLPAVVVSADSPPPGQVIAEVTAGDGRWLLCDGRDHAGLHSAITGLIGSERRVRGEAGAFVGALNDAGGDAPPTTLKLLHLLDPGTNPTVEIGRFLARAERGDDVPLTPRLVGVLEYRPRGGGEAYTLALLRRDVPYNADLETSLRDRLRRFYEERLAANDMPVVPTADRLTLASREIPLAVVDVMGDMLALARRLGARTAEMHRALAGFGDDPAFKPETFGVNYQRSLYQSLFNHANRAMRAVRALDKKADSAVRAAADALLKRETAIVERLKLITGRKLDGKRIRIHGAYHLGHILRAGDALMITGFAGDRGQLLTQRRLKRSPLRDVGIMLRSIDSIAFESFSPAAVRPADLPAITAWANTWRLYMSAAFLNSYLAAMEETGLLPSAPANRALILGTMLIEESLIRITQAAVVSPAQLPRLVSMLFDDLDAEAKL
jgi:maltose alpha-D-glucosyltransferase/alpha-amylase